MGKEKPENGNKQTNKRLYGVNTNKSSKKAAFIKKREKRGDTNGNR